MTKAPGLSLKDIAFAELALRSDAIPLEKLEKGKAAQSELSQFGIAKPLSCVLLDRRLVPQEVLATIHMELEQHSISCPKCNQPNGLKRADHQGNLVCEHCENPIQIADGRLSERELWKQEKGGRRHRKKVEKARTKTDPEGNKKSSASTAPKDPRKVWTLESAPEDELSPRREVKRFKLGPLLGASAVGKLYRIEDPTRPGVIKVIDKRLCEDKQTFDDWTSYMRALQDFPRHATPKPTQLFREETTSYVWRPFIGDETSSLKAKLQSKIARALGPGAIVKCIVEVLGALARFHTEKLVHGNLKPGNVIYAPGGTCLTDPGFFLLFDGLPAENRLVRLWDCARYQAPEVLQGEKPSFASDVYAVGRMLQDLLETSCASSVRGDHRLEAAVGRATALDPSRRHSSARELLLELEGQEADLVPAAPIPVPAAQPVATQATADRPASRIRRWLFRNAGRAALGCTLTLVAFQFLSWWRAKEALASSDHREELTREIVTQEIRDLEQSSASGTVDRAAASERWEGLRLLLAGTPFETDLRDAAERAADRSGNGNELFAQLLQRLRVLVSERSWIEAASVLAAMDESVPGREEALGLRSLVTRGLLEDKGLVLIPRGEVPRGPGDPKRIQVGPFLADARLARHGMLRGVSWTGGILPAMGGVDPEALVVGVSLPEAQQLAASLGKRLPTAHEWDRVASLVEERPGGPAPRLTSGLQDLPSPLFQWVVGGPEDELLRAGYGYLKGGDRKDAGPGHVLRRKTSAGHADVGVRFVMDLKR